MSFGKQWINYIAITIFVLLFASQGTHASNVPVQALDSPAEVVEIVQEDLENTGNVDASDSSDKKETSQSPYQTKRIVIYSTNVRKNYGESEKYVYQDGGMTILSFSTEEKTKTAYKKIVKQYGETGCFLDQMITIEDAQGNMETKTATCSSWGAETLGIPSLKNDKTIQSKKPVIVAVIDTGISTQSSIFKGKTITSTSYNFVDGNKNVMDEVGHGTHVAGIIADLTPNNVHLMILKIADEQGRSTALIMSMAMEHAVKNNASVINLSYGFISTSADQYSFLDYHIDAAYKKGIPVCVSAGNTTDGIKDRDVGNSYPACNAQTIAVSGLNKDMKLAGYSYYGEEIDYAAPGTQIVSAGLLQDKVAMDGTSMAAPHITAVMAYLKLMRNNISVEGIQLELNKICTDLGTKGKDIYYGNGCPDLKKLVRTTFEKTDWTVQKMLQEPKIQQCVNTSSGIKITWTASSGAKKYIIYRKYKGKTFRKLTTIDAKNCSYTDKKIGEGKYSSYYVVAYSKKSGQNCYSGRSNEVCTLRLKQPEISSAKYTSSSKKKISLKVKETAYWKNKKYVVQFSKKKSFKKTYTKGVTADLCSYTIKVNAKDYKYVRIRSKYEEGGKKYYSSWSSAKKIK